VSACFWSTEAQKWIKEKLCIKRKKKRNKNERKARRC
jgi:hypothetical protein